MGSYPRTPHHLPHHSFLQDPKASCPQGPQVDLSCLTLIPVPMTKMLRTSQSLPSSLPQPLPHFPLLVPPCTSESLNSWLLLTSSSLGIRRTVLPRVPYPGPSLAKDSPSVDLSPLLRTRLVHWGQVLPSPRRVGSTAPAPTYPWTGSHPPTLPIPTPSQPHS